MSIKYLLYPLITIAGLWFGADTFLHTTDRVSLIPTAVLEKKAKPIDSVSGGVILKTDSQGHFRGTALINNVEMPFLIDTGATRTSIPEKLAVAAGLKFGSTVESNTAGGLVTDHLTRINSLKIGNAEIKNLDATINQYLEEVLIGMNTLKFFKITQNGDTLTLVANNSSGKKPLAVNHWDNVMPIDREASDTPIKKPSSMKKTVTCDEHKVCTTTYSNY